MTCVVPGARCAERSAHRARVFAAFRQAMIRSRRLVLLASLAFAPPVTAQQTLVLRGGDRLSGTLTAIRGERWVFRHAGGELTLPGSDVAWYATPEPIGVRLADGAILAGRIEAAGGTMRLVAADGTTRALRPADLAAVGSPDDLDALRPVPIGYFTSIGRFWSATAGFGFSSKTGNSRSRGFAGDLGVMRDTPRDRIDLTLGLATTFSASPGSDSLEKVVEKYYGSLRLDVFLGKRVFVFGGTRQERDRFQGIDLRSNYHGGAGFQAVASEATDLRFYASGGYRREAFVSDSTFGTPVLGAGLAFEQDVGPAALTWTVDWTPRAEDFQDYRFISSAAVTTTVLAGLGFRVASRNEVNNSPPAGIEKHDWLLTTTLTYSIGR